MRSKVVNLYPLIRNTILEINNLGKCLIITDSRKVSGTDNR